MSDIYAPPSSSSLSPESTLDIEQNYIPAPRFSRWLGSVIDGIILIIPILVLMFLVAFLLNGSILHRFFLNGFIGGILISAFALAVHAAVNYVLMREGQTVGKKIMRTQVRTLDNRIPTVSEQILKRYLFQFGISALPIIGSLLGLINSLFIFGKEKRCLHDLVAGTKVIQKPVSSGTIQS